MSKSETNPKAEIRMERGVPGPLETSTSGCGPMVTPTESCAPDEFLPLPPNPPLPKPFLKWERGVLLGGEGHFDDSGFGIRDSFGFRISTFGFDPLTTYQNMKSNIKKLLVPLTTV